MRDSRNSGANALNRPPPHPAPLPEGAGTLAGHAKFLDTLLRTTQGQIVIRLQVEPELRGDSRACANSQAVSEVTPRLQRTNLVDPLDRDQDVRRKRA